MSVSDRDRAFMARVAAYKAESHAEAQARHLALPLDERLRRSWELYLAGREAGARSERDDDPSPFYAQARALGLCA
jgi:hypothetical protein